MTRHPMVVGACTISLFIPASQSLKDKRQVVRSLIGRVQSQFKVAIAEVGEVDRWQVATLGVSCVANEGHHAREVLEKIVRFVESNCSEGEVIRHEIELISV